MVATLIHREIGNTKGLPGLQAGRTVELGAGWVGNALRHREEVAEDVHASIWTSQYRVPSKRSWTAAVTSSVRRDNYRWRAGRTPTKLLCVGEKAGRCSRSTGISLTPGSSRITEHPAL